MSKKISTRDEKISDNVIGHSSFAQMIDSNIITNREQLAPNETDRIKNTRIDEMFQSELINNESTSNNKQTQTGIQLINCEEEKDMSNLTITSEESDGDIKSLTFSQKNALNYLKNTFNHTDSAE